MFKLQYVYVTATTTMIVISLPGLSIDIRLESAALTLNVDPDANGLPPASPANEYQDGPSQLFGELAKIEDIGRKLSTGGDSFLPINPEGRTLAHEKSQVCNVYSANILSDCVRN